MIIIIAGFKKMFNISFFFFTTEATMKAQSSQRNFTYTQMKTTKPAENQTTQPEKSPCKFKMNDSSFSIANNGTKLAF